VIYGIVGVVMQEDLKFSDGVMGLQVTLGVESVCCGGFGLSGHFGLWVFLFCSLLVLLFLFSSFFVCLGLNKRFNTLFFASRCSSSWLTFVVIVLGIEFAWIVFNEKPKWVCVSWSAMIGGCVWLERLTEAIHMFRKL
jgi:hypothetical protein